MHRYLAKRPSAIDGETLIRDYCSNNVKVDRVLAEIALIQLLNQGKVETNRALKVQVATDKAV